jgi:dihydropteroate synthase
VTSILERFTKKEVIFDFSKQTAKMGILNCTPDSIDKNSNPNKKINYNEVFQKYKEYCEEGFEICDIGGML